MTTEETSETNYPSPDTCDRKALGTKNQPSIKLKTQENGLSTQHLMPTGEFSAGPLNYWPPERLFEAPETSQKWSKNHLKIIRKLEPKKQWQGKRKLDRKPSKMGARRSSKHACY